MTDESWRTTHGRTYRVGRAIQFSASHALPNVPPGHKCHRLHGHTYTVAVEVEGDMDPTTGWVMDFGHLDVALRTLVFDVLDHRHLNDIAGLENPTSEAVASWVADRIQAHVNGIAGKRLYGVRVLEGERGGWAELTVTRPLPPVDDAHAHHVRATWEAIDANHAARAADFSARLASANPTCARCAKGLIT